MAAVLALGALAGGCYHPAPYQCHTPYAHPTMSPGDIAQRVDMNVRSVTEGAAGGVTSTRQPLAEGREGGFVW